MFKKFLKKYFIPHKENEYKPHLFREASIFVLFFTIITTFVVVWGGQIIVRNTDMTALVLPKVLVDYANEDRKPQNLNSLKINPVLEKAAMLKAKDMAEKGYFSHNTPEGHSPWYWLDRVGYDFSYAGENLAVNFNDSSEVNSAWMNSPGHRQNIMNSNFTEVGIATADGVYQGRNTTFVVQFFGRPSNSQLSKVVKTNVQKPVQKTVVVEQTPKAEKVLGASEETKSDVKYSSFLEKIIFSPSKSLSIVYIIISIIIIVGLLLMIFIEIKKQHPFYIFLGIILLVLMFLIMYLYKSVIIEPLLIA